MTIHTIPCITSNILRWWKCSKKKWSAFKITRLKLLCVLHKIVTQFLNFMKVLWSAAITRDVSKLLALDAVKVEWDQAGQGWPLISVNLDWPSTITETEFFEKIKELPKSKDYSFLTKP